MNCSIVEKSKLNTKLMTGQKVSHDKLGKGVIVGFSEITGNPFVFFYNQQEIYGDRPVCVDNKTVSHEN